MPDSAAGYAISKHGQAIGRVERTRDEGWWWDTGRGGYGHTNTMAKAIKDLVEMSTK